MPDLPVVEELLEKGARWLARFDETDYETGGSARQRWYLDRAGQMLDAVFPGWREGITREWGIWAFGEPDDSGTVWTDQEVGTPAAKAELTDWREDYRPEDQHRINFVPRLVVRSAWVPVEEGTDG